jgi:hypothetical protein
MAVDSAVRANSSDLIHFVYHPDGHATVENLAEHHNLLLSKLRRQVRSTTRNVELDFVITGDAIPTGRRK